MFVVYLSRLITSEGYLKTCVGRVIRCHLCNSIDSFPFQISNGRGHAHIPSHFTGPDVGSILVLDLLGHQTSDWQRSDEILDSRRLER